MIAAVLLVRVAAGIALLVALAAARVEIVDRPIAFDEERVRLALEYRRLHVDPAAEDIAIVPRVVVLHYTGGGSLESAWRTFNRTRLPAARARIRAGGEVNVAAHFLVDRDGTIYRLMPETRMGRHVIGLNHVAIGVENVGDGERFPLTRAQIDANARLIRYLAARHPITHLIGHHEYREMEGHPYFEERDPTYRNRKPDPGPDFMREVRALVADLGLEGPP